VTGIQGESDKQASRPLMASDPLEEYLSLSMNQRYPKYTRRDNGQARKPVPASDPMEEEADAQGDFLVLHPHYSHQIVIRSRQCHSQADSSLMSRASKSLLGMEMEPNSVQVRQM